MAVAPAGTSLRVGEFPWRGANWCRDCIRNPACCRSHSGVDLWKQIDHRTNRLHRIPRLSLGSQPSVIGAGSVSRVVVNEATTRSISCALRADRGGGAGGAGGDYVARWVWVPSPLRASRSNIPCSCRRTSRAESNFFFRASPRRADGGGAPFDGGLLP